MINLKQGILCCLGELSIKTVEVRAVTTTCTVEWAAKAHVLYLNFCDANAVVAFCTLSGNFSKVIYVLRR